jgi:hypothetical protein
MHSIINSSAMVIINVEGSRRKSLMVKTRISVDAFFYVLLIYEQQGLQG